MAEREPAGYVVAFLFPDGVFDLETVGMWPDRAQAETEAGHYRHAEIAQRTGGRYAVCAVTPLEDPR